MTKLMVEHWSELMSVQIGPGSLDGSLGHLPRFVLIVTIISNHQPDSDFLQCMPRSKLLIILVVVLISGCAEWVVDCF